MRIVKIDTSTEYRFFTIYFDRTFLPAGYRYDYRKRVTISWHGLFDKRVRSFAYVLENLYPPMRQSIHLYFFIIEYENYG